MNITYRRHPANRHRYLYIRKGSLYIPKAICEGPVRFGDLYVARGFVLPNHQRVLTHQAMLELLDMGGGGTGKKRSYRLGNFAAQDRFNDFISKELKDLIFHPIFFRTVKGQIAYGYEAFVLADLCEAILKARDAGRLMEAQQHIAERAELLIRAFARVGIVALIDEATGYQSTRAQDALQHYVHDVFLTYYRRKWKKAFDLQWFEQLCRLQGWTFDPHSMRMPRRSSLLIDRLVYLRLPPGVREALHLRNRKRPDGTRRDKHHQWLSEDEGLRHLDRLLQMQIRLMKGSKTWEEFLALVDRFYPVPLLLEEGL